MRTIFVTSLNPFVTRNILFTDVFKNLSSWPNTRLVVFCPDYKLDYFKKNFQKENVIIEGIKNEAISKQDVIFAYLGRSLIRTQTLAIHRKEIFLRNKNLPAYLLSYFLSWVGWFSSVKKIARFLDLKTISQTKFAKYFDAYKPDLVFSRGQE